MNANMTTAEEKHPTEIAILERAATRATQIDAETRYAARLEDRELRGVLRNLVIEIDHEPIDERRAMLEFAAVESMLIDRSAIDAARAARVLRELDPADARLLVRISNTSATGIALAHASGDLKYAHGIAKKRVLEASTNREAIELIGLVKFDESYAGRGYELPLGVTRRGELVIEVLGAWL